MAIAAAAKLPSPFAPSAAAPVELVEVDPDEVAVPALAVDSMELIAEEKPVKVELACVADVTTVDPETMVV